ncbi:hypothetical protein SK128_024449 [Halocaridina rubra]|uniref:Uncharacterized protein n=1 Tax=Halocaridina rubra TaxID=373956 RepID=A0AAN9A7J7_HALRR
MSEVCFRFGSFWLNSNDIGKGSSKLYFTGDSSPDFLLDMKNSRLLRATVHHNFITSSYDVPKEKEKGFKQNLSLTISKSIHHNFITSSDDALKEEEKAKQTEFITQYL